MRRGLMTLIPLAILLIAPLSSVTSVSSALTQSQASWTLMMYMAGDYPPDLPWESNLVEMEAARQSPQTNIIALVDPLGPNNTKLVRIEHQATPSSTFLSPTINGSGIFPDGGDANMASSETLARFITYTWAKYPAENLVLFLWGHGGDWIGLLPDATEIMSLPELRSALKNATQAIGRPLDMIVVDACTESSVEMLLEVRGYARYFAASESNIPSTGLPYTSLLNHLAAQGDGSVWKFGRSIVNDYVNWARYNSTYSATMALFNVSKMDRLETALDSLSEQGARYDSIFHGDMNTVLTSAEHYTNDWGVDFGDLMSKFYGSNLPLEIRKTALDALMAYIDSRIISESVDNAAAQDGIRVHRATGATIYADSGGFADYFYGNLQIASTQWALFGRLARHVASTNMSAPGPSLTYGDENSDGQPESVTLSWPQNYDSSGIWVFREDHLGGLEFLENVSVAGSHLTYSGHPGYLVISASVSNGSVAQSHTPLKVALFGSTKVTVRTVGEEGKEFTVRVTIRNSTLMATTAGGRAEFNLTVPTQAGIRDLVSVQILDRGSGKVVGNGVVQVGESESVAIIDVAHPPSSQRYPADMVLMAMLPGLLVLVYDLLLVREERRKRK